MNDYDNVRHLVDSYGLIATVILFLVLVFWALRPGLRRHYDEAARMIFSDESENTPNNGGQSNG